VQDIINDERVRTVSTQGSHEGEPEEGEIVDISQRGDSPRKSPQSRRLTDDRRSDHLSRRNPSVTSSLIKEDEGDNQRLSLDPLRERSVLGIRAQVETVVPPLGCHAAQHNVSYARP
jgi:hypothetical protein